MRVEIIGTESLGVRGLSCVVELKDRKILIDPGVSLGYSRHGLLPHPVQVAMGEDVRQRILDELEDVTDIVFSHFHGDHVPLYDANPFQMHAMEFRAVLRRRNRRTPTFWTKTPSGKNMMQRMQLLRHALGVRFKQAEGRDDGVIAFSPPVPHGARDEHRGTVMMTRIREGDEVFVHASDIQLLDSSAVSLILKWRPTIVIASGPPLYLNPVTCHLRHARRNTIKLAFLTEKLILDHHLMRSENGCRWMEDLSAETGRNIICAADFMNRERFLLEAWRDRLYTAFPVQSGWHEAYAKGLLSAHKYRKMLPYVMKRIERLRSETRSQAGSMRNMRDWEK